MTHNPSHIVIGFDFTAESDPALEQGLFRATQNLPAAVHVLTVLSTDMKNKGLHHSPTYIDAARIESALFEVAGDALQHVARRDLHIFTHARIGHPANEILALANEVMADLVVVGSHRRQGLKRLALGSVAQEVVQNAQCPVHIALPRQYFPESRQEIAPEPACPTCLDIRQRTGGKTMWCVDHSRPYSPPRRYDITNRSIVEMRPDEWILW